MSSLQATSSTAAAEAGGKGDGSDALATWRAKVQATQRSSQTPESIAASRTRQEGRARAHKSASRAKRLQTVQSYSKSAWGGTMVSLRSASSAPTQLEVPRLGRGGGAFGGPPLPPPQQQQQQEQEHLALVFGDVSSASQTAAEAGQRADLASLAMASLQRAASLSDEEEAEAEIEAARRQLESAGHAWAKDGAAGAASAALALGGAAASDDDGSGSGGGSGSGAGGVLEALLRDLRREPEDDADAARRFKLYEEHADTVATVRRALFAFWDGAKSDVPAGPPRAAIEASLRACDSAERLECQVDDRHWFVYSMARKVTANEASLGAVLREVETKLELLGAQTDCPICLEPIDCEGGEGEDSGLALGCAHSLHRECWRHWSAHCASRNKAAFCPLCRNDDFLDEIF